MSHFLYLSLLFIADLLNCNSVRIVTTEKSKYYGQLLINNKFISYYKLYTSNIDLIEFEIDFNALLTLN